MSQFKLLTVFLLCVVLAGCGVDNRQSPAQIATESIPVTEPPVADPFERAASDGQNHLEDIGRLAARESTEPVPEPQTDAPTAAPTEMEPEATDPAVLPDAAQEQEPVFFAAEEIPAEPALSPQTDSTRSVLGAVETQLFELINQYRAQNQLEPLGLEDSMQFAAAIRAQEALSSLSHTRPDGSPYHTVFDEAGFSYTGKWHGENLAVIHIPAEEYNEAEIAAALFEEWRRSAGHSQNMLGENFYQTGVAVFVQADGERMSIGSAQLFAGF